MSLSTLASWLHTAASWPWPKRMAACLCVWYLVMGVGYVIAGDFKRAAYWFGAVIINYSVTF